MMDIRNQGNAYFKEENYKKSIECYTKEINHPRGNDIYKVYSNRSAAYLKLGGHQNYLLALADAQQCIALNQTWTKGYSRLGDAYYRLAKFKQAIEAYKNGLKLDEHNKALEDGLKLARIRMLDGLLAQQDDMENLKDNQCTSIKETTTILPQKRMETTVTTTGTGSSSLSMFKLLSKHTTTKLDEMMQNLTMQSFARAIAVNAIKNLQTVPMVQPAMICLLVGIISNVIVHYKKVAFLLIVFLLLQYKRMYQRLLEYTIKEFNETVDKIRSIAIIPSIFYCVPIGLEIYGQYKLFSFVGQNITLACLLFGFLSCYIFYTSGIFFKKEKHLEKWGEKRCLRLSIHLVVYLYYIVYLQEYHLFTKLLGPLATQLAGFLLSCCPPEKIHDVIRKCIKDTLNEVTCNMTTNVSLDMTFFVGLIAWLVDYWQQPTNIDLHMIMATIAKTLTSMEASAIGLVKTKIEELKTQINLQVYDEDFDVLVLYLKKSLHEIPPHKTVGYFIIFLRECPSIVTFLLLLGSGNTIPIALLPFLYIERKQLSRVYQLATHEEFHDLDCIDLILHNSTLLIVWVNLKVAVTTIEYARDAKKDISQVVTTGVSAVRLSNSVRRLFQNSQCIREKGVEENMEKIGDMVTDMVHAIQDARIIVEGVPSFASLASWCYRAVHWWGSSSSDEPPLQKEKNQEETKNQKEQNQEETKNQKEQTVVEE